MVIAGKDKGKSGEVFRALPQTDQVVIEGVHMVKRHQKSRQSGSAGQIVEKPMPIHISNVALIDSATGKGARVGFDFEGDQKIKTRVTRGGSKRK